jgi:hypothetical protein
MALEQRGDGFHRKEETVATQLALGGSVAPGCRVKNARR